MPITMTAHGQEATITVSPHRYELHTLAEAMSVEVKARGWKASRRLLDLFDYMDDDLAAQPRLFRYRGQWYDMWDTEFLWADRLPTGGILHTLARQGWTAWASDSAWSGTVFRYLTGDDDGFVRVARVVWS